MKYFKFWIQEKFTIDVQGERQDISILSGSNISKDAARYEAQEHSKSIEARVNDGKQEEYQSPIKEYVEDVIDPANIITVCRYGAKVLNTNQYTILDLDDYPFSFLDLFKGISKLSKKERIVYKFEERLKKYPQLGKSFRIYETHKGVRVIGNKYLDLKDHKSFALLKRFGVDRLYLFLSRKQDCYRARLTPKPYRMKAKTIKIKTPLDCETSVYTEWNKKYLEAAQAFSVVNLIKVLGADFSNDKVIKVHDRICRLEDTMDLA